MRGRGRGGIRLALNDLLEFVLKGIAMHLVMAPLCLQVGVRLLVLLEHRRMLTADGGLLSLVPPAQSRELALKTRGGGRGRGIHSGVG